MLVHRRNTPDVTTTGILLTTAVHLLDGAVGWLSLQASHLILVVDIRWATPQITARN